MKVSVVTAPGETRVVEAPRPEVASADVLVKIRACGICGTDAFFISIGGVPGHDGAMPIGHEPAGEVVEVGRDVTGIVVGDHVVVNPMVAPSGIIGNGGARARCPSTCSIEDAARGMSLEVVPDHMPFEVAALNEPMAVARHGVNRCAPKPADKVVGLRRRPDRARRGDRIQIRLASATWSSSTSSRAAGEGAQSGRRRGHQLRRRGRRRAARSSCTGRRDRVSARRARTSTSTPRGRRQ